MVHTVQEDGPGTEVTFVVENQAVYATSLPQTSGTKRVSLAAKKYHFLKELS